MSATQAHLLEPETGTLPTGSFPGWEEKNVKSSLGIDQIMARTNVLPIVTPLNTDGTVVTDEAELNGYLDHIQSLGITHLFVLGETGEFRFLSDEQKIAFAEALIPLAKKRDMIVFLNATSGDYQNTLSLLDRLGKMPGVDALILCPLWQTNSLIFGDLESGKVSTEKPLVFYNNPGITHGFNVKVEDLARVRGKFAALKDSSGDFSQLTQYNKAAGEMGFFLYNGAEQSTAELLNPASSFRIRGVVAATGQVNKGYSIMLDVPEHATREKMQKGLDKLTCELTHDRRAITAGLKKELHRLGIITNDNVAPGTSLLPY